MIKILLLIDCDCCRRQFQYSRTAVADYTAHSVHPDALEEMAYADGWGVSEDGGSHYCPVCLRDSEEMMLQSSLLKIE